MRSDKINVKPLDRQENAFVRGNSVNLFFEAVHGTLYQGDALTVLRTLPPASVQCCVTSPPYWGLRDYGVSGQIGMEDTHEAHVDCLLSVFREVRRVLKNDGTLWVTYGDTFSFSADKRNWQPRGKQATNTAALNIGLKKDWRLPPKNLLGLPWRMAFALQDDGWYLRSDIIWHKPNPMPESVRDRPTRSHEYLFFFSKRAKYFYDREAMREPVAAQAEPYPRPGIDVKGGNQGSGGIPRNSYTRNKRDVWTVPTSGYRDAHFATFPPALIEPCIRAGSRLGDTVLDPFMGSGTTGMVARNLGRRWVGVELNPEYCALCLKRIGVNA
jgi:DNA modification methylase